MLTRETENWDEDQQWEADWWGNCANTMAEEVKQISYAHRMGLLNEPRDGKWPVYDLAGKSVIDIGGGPVSMLLKTVNGGSLVVADPCPYPDWVNERYTIHNIAYEVIAGENLVDESEFADFEFDEAWIYNVLQHVQDPAKILDNARKLAKVVRIFEWVDIPPHTGHPHELKAQKLGEWLGGSGVVEQMNENGCNGRAFYGVFSGY
jgi:2-polyprenyl-3-methyl-5-hydroxy-6-metoxy-1,4-benzoquinol methylase